jgi:hypothetical protein
MSINCDICDYKINTINIVIKCPYCSFECCHRCTTKYLLMNSQAHCMSCKELWNDDFLYSSLSPKFLNNEYKKHNTGIIFEQEKSMMPETMVIVNNMKRIDVLKEKIDRLKSKIGAYEEEIYQLTHFKKEKNEEKMKINIIKECPDEECKGYLNNKLVCGLCEIELCSDCEKIKEYDDDGNDDHECDKNDIDTVKMKKSECKSCPVCSKITYKDGGCDQVWCPPPCNNGVGTAWKFSTGQIDKDRPHAPLYYEYQRKMNNGVVPPYNPCIDDVLPNIWDITHLIPRVLDKGKDIEKRVGLLHQKITHIKYVELDRYREKINDTFEKNLDLRLKYLRDEIEEDRFKKTLIQRYKRDKKNKAIYENIEMLVNVVTDIFIRLKAELVNLLAIRYNSKRYKEKFEKIIQLFENDIDNIKKYYKKSIYNTLDRFNCKIKNLDTIF